MNSSNSCKIWGLFNKTSNVGVPLKSLDISIKILQNIAQVLYTQTYYNKSETLLESEFFFPISPEACFDSFEAKFNNKTIKGVIKEKEKAKEEYKEAIQQGRTAAYSEIQEETGDIMKVMIGNIPPDSEVTIIYSYIEKLEISLNKFWCFRLFSTVTPRYNGNLQDLLNKQDIAILSSYPTVSSKFFGAYPWNIQAEIQSPSPITFLQSPSHDVLFNYGNENHTCKVTFKPNSKNYPNKDFVLLFSNGKENSLNYLLTPFEGDYCAMVTFLANIDEKSEAEAYSQLAKAKVKDSEISHEIDTVRGEYLFLIDRSGSMAGERIIMARNSLLLFLKSLPKDSFFNIISFGSNHKFLHPTSIQYSPNSLKSSTKEVENFGADFGGTEIYAALNAIYSSPLMKGYPRFIFLLTDGDVSNTNQILDLIKSNSEKARVFTVGIGNGCSPELITKGASFGKGKHEFVSDNKETYEKVISVLNASLSPCYSDLTLEADNFDALVRCVTPNPTTLPFMLNGQPVTFFLVIRKNAFEVTQTMPLKLRFYDSRIKDYRTLRVNLDINEAFENDMLPKLAIHDMIKRLETQNEHLNQKELNIIWLDKDEIKKALLELSLKYGILCKATAFFCEIADNEGKVLDLQKTQVIVPTILSKDYDHESKVLSCQRPVLSKNYDHRSIDLRCKSIGTKEGSRGFDRGGMYLSAAPRDGGVAACCGGGGSCCGAGGGSYYESSLSSDLSVERPSKKLSSQSKAGRQCLDVIMKQNFEGYWDASDKELKLIVLKGGNVLVMPKEVKENGLNETMWMTIIVLLWLEMACKEERKVWMLIHKKGCEWLKTKNVNYEEVKGIANSVIQI